jgi:class 3 adenylate cyclase
VEERSNKMGFYEILDQVVDLLRRRGRVTYRALQREFQLDEDTLTDLKDELLYAHPEVRDDAGRGLVWTSTPDTVSTVVAPAASPQDRPPLAYTPAHLAEQILAARGTLEGERKQITVLFADLKGSSL